jgi:hypothetical protein
MTLPDSEINYCGGMCRYLLYIYEFFINNHHKSVKIGTQFGKSTEKRYLCENNLVKNKQS